MLAVRCCLVHAPTCATLYSLDPSAMLKCQTCAKDPGRRCSHEPLSPWYSRSCPNQPPAPLCSSLTLLSPLWHIGAAWTDTFCQLMEEYSPGREYAKRRGLSHTMREMMMAPDNGVPRHDSYSPPPHPETRDIMMDDYMRKCSLYSSNTSTSSVLREEKYEPVFSRFPFLSFSLGVPCSLSLSFSLSPGVLFFSCE